MFMSSSNNMSPVQNTSVVEITQNKPELSVVVLCYKSGNMIVPFLEQMERELKEGGIHDYELVLVGNYFPNSGDTTPAIIRKLADNNPQIRAITLEKKGMMGWDVRSGLAAARGHHIVLIDGDGQMPTRDVVRLYRVMRGGEFDLVKTFRKERMDGTYRKLISAWYNILFRILFPKTYFRDVNSKPKIMTRAAYEKMKLVSDGWFIDAEMMLESMRHDLSVGELATVFHKNEWRGSFVKFWTIFEFISNLVRYRIKHWFQ